MCPCRLPPQLLPRLGLHWVVPIEALHAITFACGWSGERAVQNLPAGAVCAAAAMQPAVPGAAA
jgi:hypothetical protein